MNLNDTHYPQVIVDGTLNMDNPLCNPGCNHVRERITTVADDVTCPNYQRDLLAAALQLADGVRHDR